MCRALAGKILTFLTCMPAGDSKNEPHQEQKPSFFFQCGRAITWKHTLQPGAPRFNRTNAAAPLQRLSARAAKERQEKNNNQNSNGVFFSS